MQGSFKPQPDASWMQGFSQETEDILFHLDAALKDAFIFFPRAVRSLHQQIAQESETVHRSPEEKAALLNSQLSEQLPKSADEALPFLTRYLWERNLGIESAEDLHKVKSITQNYVQLLNSAGGKINETELTDTLSRILSVN